MTSCFNLKRKNEYKNNRVKEMAQQLRGSKVQVWVLERLEEIKEKKLCSCIVIKSI